MFSIPIVVLLKGLFHNFIVSGFVGIDGCSCCNGEMRKMKNIFTNNIMKEICAAVILIAVIMAATFSLIRVVAFVE